MIRILPTNLVNQIAAGEVIERPSAVVKELVENALDAGATTITIACEDGGRSLVRITDNGKGMSKDDLPLAIVRHATSKLSDDDLFNITTNGFRGEALPSIGAVSRLTLISRTHDSPDAWKQVVEGGHVYPVCPAVHHPGTTVEVRDLFYATPARLHFLKSERAETSAIKDIITRLALAHPQVTFTFQDHDKTSLSLKGVLGEVPDCQRTRLSQILGEAQVENMVPVDANREELYLRGFISVPTLNQGTAANQYVYVNGRAIKDKQILSLARVAYQDFLARDRHPLFVLYLDVPPSFVDVNVHPTKFEVRFRDPALVRGLIIGALKNVLHDAGHQASTTLSTAALGAFRPSSVPSSYTPSAPRFYTPSQTTFKGLSEPSASTYRSHYQAPPLASNSDPVQALDPDYPLGAACAQVHSTYIVAQTAEGLVLVDQHAAHERLVYEKMKRDLQTGTIKRQVLLIPDVVDLPGDQATLLLERAEELAEFGLCIEPFGKGALLVRETPALLGHIDSKKILEDLAHQLLSYESHTALKEKLEDVCASMACRGSVRSGRKLSADEMNALLRDMEQTPHSGQCNHGRPTYVELKLKDIEKLFGRR